MNDVPPSQPPGSVEMAPTDAGCSDPVTAVGGRFDPVIVRGLVGSLGHDPGLRVLASGLPQSCLVPVVMRLAALVLVLGLLRDVEERDEVEVHLSRERGSVLVRALRDYLAIECELADSHDLCQRERHGTRAAMRQRLLSMSLSPAGRAAESEARRRAPQRS